MEFTNGAYIIDNLGKILVTHPTGLTMGVWSIPKGLNDEGESSLEATIREVKEETRIDLKLFSGIYKYRDLGKILYKSKKKYLHGHSFFIDLPLSEMNFNLMCDSTFICKTTGVEIPENDITMWVDYKFANDFLHESQQTFLKTIKELFV